MIIDGQFSTTSEVKGEEVSLDLRQVILFGFHRGVDREHVAGMLEGIAAGANFPPVKVARIGPSVYMMTFLIDSETGKPDGGHHRAYAHYVANKPLKCEIIPTKHIANHSNIPISEITYRK